MNPAEGTIIAVDCGTQSLRLIIFEKDGTLLAKEQVCYKPYDAPKPGWAEQNTEVWWGAFCTAVGKIKQSRPELLKKARGIGITSQRDTVILIDREGKVLRPAITWLDTRQARGSYHPSGIMKAVYKFIGMYDKIIHSQSAGQCNWIRENEPEVWQKTWKVLMVSGYFNYRLTGIPADSPASIVAHLPFSHKKRHWAGKSDITYKIFPMENDKKCTVIESGEFIGRVTKQAALQTGLPEGLPVIACGSDKACETLGMGCIDTNTASLSFGTTATVEVCIDRYIEPLPFFPAYSAACPGCWVPEIEIFRGYWMISWFKNELGYEERLKATATGIIPEKIMDSLLDASPPGCYGLMLQPYWGASLKDDYAKGSIIGFGDVHGRHAMYRAIIEGLAYSLREGLEQLEKRGGFRVKQIAVSGGASQSNRICQITANILNRPLVRGSITEASALGAAVLTAKGTGFYDSINTSIKHMVRYERTFMPNPEHRKLYDGLYRTYTKIYPALKDIYKEIREITGYPS
ncbi:FGGY-family carbohydrate kinase [Treponema sp. HNW]|uniref:FGGY-family carbohydrate kinase n=1 Tax=Treponema sp. HNW TaxID=3116654 RepID=UPI003D0CDD65